MNNKDHEESVFAPERSAAAEGDGVFKPEVPGSVASSENAHSERPDPVREVDDGVFLPELEEEDDWMHRIDTLRQDILQGGTRPDTGPSEVNPVSSAERVDTAPGSGGGAGGGGRFFLSGIGFLGSLLFGGVAAGFTAFKHFVGRMSWAKGKFGGGGGGGGGSHGKASHKPSGGGRKGGGGGHH